MCISIPVPVNIGVIVCPLQPSSSVSPGCHGPESSVPVSARLACPINSQVTNTLWLLLAPPLH